MRKAYAIFLIIFAIVLGAHAQGNPPLRLIHTTPLPGIQGDLEHFAYDLKGNRLFLGTEDHKTVEVFNLRTGERLHSITGFKAPPHALLYLLNSNQLLVTAGDGVGMVDVFSGDDYKLVKTIDLLPGVDCALYDPATHYYYVQSGVDDPSWKTHYLHIIDTETLKHIGDIILPGSHSEAMAIDQATERLYVNLTRVDEVGVVDLKKRQLVATWPLTNAHAREPVPMELDARNHRLFIATRHPAKLLVFDTNTGKIIAALPCVGENDNMTFDSASKRIYISGNGAVGVYEERDPDHYVHVADVPSAYRTKTHIFVPELNRLYVAASGKFKPGTMLKLLVFQIEP